MCNIVHIKQYSPIDFKVISIPENSNKLKKIRFGKKHQLKMWLHLGQRHNPH